MNLLNRLLMAVGDLFWPPMCATCPHLLPLVDSPEKPEAHFCPNCLENIEFMPQNSCPLCGRPYYHLATTTTTTTSQPKPHLSHVCGDCLKSPPPFHSARSALIYRNTTAKAISDLKYHGHLNQVPALASLVRDRLTPPLIPGTTTQDPKNTPNSQMPDAIVPIPLTPARLAHRGFNQATELAKAIYQPWDTLINEKILVRSKNNKASQTNLTRTQRQKAIIGSFHTPNPQAVKGLRILLFDDVLTTGATATEATQTLLKAGATQVNLTTIARTVLTKT